MMWRAEHLERASHDAHEQGNRYSDVADAATRSSDVMGVSTGSILMQIAMVQRELAQAIAADLESLARRIEGGIG